MREIKFRAWDILNKEMHYDNAAVLESLSLAVKYKNPKIVEYMQFTGLKDRNGVEIYEGDIVEYVTHAYQTTENEVKKRISRVFWSDFRASWSVYGNDKSKLTNNDLFHYVRNGNRVEVIGNIYENKDLLATV